MKLQILCQQFFCGEFIPSDCFLSINFFSLVDLGGMIYETIKEWAGAAKKLVTG